MVFRLANTFASPSTGSGTQRGFPAPGSGAQSTGPSPGARAVTREAETGPVRPTKGRRSWFAPSEPQDAQRGFPGPLAGGQRRSKGSTVPEPRYTGDNGSGVSYVAGPVYSAGANQYVPQTGTVLSNPIGAGIVATHRPQASYGSAGQYYDGAIWWTSQDIPTSINPAGLVDPQELSAILGDVYVQAVVRTTG